MHKANSFVLWVVWLIEYILRIYSMVRALNIYDDTFAPNFYDIDQKTEEKLYFLLNLVLMVENHLDRNRFEVKLANVRLVDLDISDF